MIVLDASAVLELLLRTSRSRTVEEALFDRREDAHAPDLLDLEVVQVLRRYERARVLSAGRCREAFDDLASLPLTRHRPELFLARVFELRKSVSAYDGIYVALAEALDAPLLTADGRLARSHGHRARVELVG